MKRVCVTVPEGCVDDIKSVAEQMRAKAYLRRQPGWDSKLIAEIARKKFGGYTQMFDHFDWPERGSKMVTTIHARVKQKFGSVEAFAEFYGYEV